MQTDEKSHSLGWGDLKTCRPRLPQNIVSEIDRIRNLFTDPEDAEQYILDCLNKSLKVHRVRLHDSRVSATPGVTGADGDDGYEEVEVPTMLVKNPGKSFLVRVAGDSMVDAGIPDGAYILVKEVNPLFEPPRDREIVTATVNDQLLIKRYRYRYKKHELVSENRKKNYPPIPISLDGSDHESVYIFGIYQQIIPESMMNIVSI